MCTSQDPGSLFLNALLATTVQFNENLDAVSRKILNNLQLRIRQNGETKDLERFKTEEQRIEAIERDFGVKLSQEERDGIRGRKVAVDQFKLQSELQN
jgi:hypothetical protein